MLIYRRTSILESPVQTLVNTVNCVGVMGKGLAHAFKEREPAMFKAYKDICDRGALMPGKLWLWRGQGSWVLNFPTKVHWRHPSKLEWIEAGLAKFVSAFETQGITEISFPRLGCGNGGLDWEEVRPLMEHYLSDLPIPVYIHDYTVDVGFPEHLEPVAAALREDASMDGSFDSFIAGIEQAINVSGGILSTLGAGKEFAVKMRDGRALAIELPTSTCLFEEDDLRGVWLDLQNGLLTKRKAGWAVPNGAEPLISLISVLPTVRPVEIQRPGQTDPEYAIECRPEMRGVFATEQVPAQIPLAWH